MDVRLKFSSVFDPQILGLAANKRLEIFIRAMVEFSEGNRFLACQVFDSGDLGRSGMAKLMGDTIIDDLQSSRQRQKSPSRSAERRHLAILPHEAMPTALWIVRGACA